MDLGKRIDQLGRKIMSHTLPHRGLLKHNQNSIMMYCELWFSHMYTVWTAVEVFLTEVV